MIEITDIKQKIIEKANSIGFDSIGFAPVSIPDRNKKRLHEFLDEKSYGTMEWMAGRIEHRESPEGLWPEVKSVIVLGLNYGPSLDPMIKNLFHERANISVYAQNKDYHDLVKKRLKQLARWIVEQNFTTQSDTDVKVFVDTAPVLEKAIAAQSTLGWQGKHTNIVSRDYGSWLFLGEIFTTLELPADEPEKDHCGSCKDCQIVCPTDAFPAPYKLDAKRCISYLTIEHQGMIDEEFRKPMGNRIYGCDDCLAACPWNKFASRSKEADFWPRPELKGPRLIDFLDMDDASFRQFFTASPVKRIGRERFLRNVLIALGNSGNPTFTSKIENLLEDPSPTIRGSAVWALKCLYSQTEFAKFRASYI
ncbi:tRNA epoxyqueuosine(34) reductase QueG, partial [Curvivirga aplysinae]|uniref:tRNA epoxyqueuosine(34) reductase QueG n=1 Tax=Curvivirga aplysinae TaxID=2529852 RepID=UPI0012BB5EBE